MKTKITLILFLLFTFTIQLEAQVFDSLISPTIRYKKDMPVIDGDTLLFNDKMLNVLFAEKVGTAFGGSNDLSLQKFYLSLDDEDKSMSFGLNIDSRRGEELERLNWVFSGGLKLKSTNKFATVIDDEGVFQKDNIGATFKVTLIGRGTIDYTSNTKKVRDSAIINNRRKIFEKFDKKVEKYNNEELESFKKEHNISRKYDKELDCSDKLLEEKHDKMYTEIAKEEIAFLEDNNMYRFISNKWLSIELFAPLGKQTYNVTNDANTPYKKERFHNINGVITGNYMRYFSSGESVFLKAALAFKNNNTIIANNLSAKVFQTTSPAINNNEIVETEEVYITPYEEFITTTFTFEPAFFFLSTSFGDFGLSPSVEFNFGTYDKTNWKLGIPFSLKDKEGKPKVNFELQYKSIGTLSKTENVFGISTSFLFGDMIN
ncbi:MAG: hypothetical protein HWD89_03405 [Tenacibaculum sp.]|uniref:hypothetical protein n=1 Tax=Tenacibaculum sp. TaxID=1906242 RepID=UPI0017A86B37|nr:hypothetical protein [Tenacibaculum sp.]NVK08073.1 hypothetical protein [Tenacibaculum sp.]